MNIEITQDFVVYQSQTKLLEIGYEIAQSRSVEKPAILALRQRGTMIRLWLKALNDDYINRPTRERIWYALMDLADCNAIPYAPSIINTSPPSILVGIKGDKGDTGSTGATGGGIAFSASNVGMDTVVDSFDISLAPSAEWQYPITSGSNLRVESLIGGWLSDGSQFTDTGGLATTDIGTTSPVYFSVNVSGTTAQLIMHVASGTWNVVGSRLFIPVSGNGITLPTSLTNGTIWIGNSSNQPTAQTFTGDVTVTNAGVTAIGAGKIVNAQINSSAAIAVSKFAAMTASRAVVTDSSGFLTTSTATAVQVGYLSNVTSDIQTQINTIAGAGTITGAITTYVTSNATASRAIVSNAAGKLTTAITTDTEISYVSGVTSAIQTQLDSLSSGKVAKTGDTMSGALNSSSTGEFDGGVRTQNSGAYLKTAVFNIGDWNMNSTLNVDVTHGLDPSKIRLVFVNIQNDSSLNFYDLTTCFDGASTVAPQGTIEFLSTSGFPNKIRLRRVSPGLFASVAFDSTSFNRGWVTITYEA